MAGLINAGNFKRKEDIVGLLDTTPEVNEPKAGVPMGCLVRGEHGFPAQEVCNSIAT